MLFGATALVTSFGSHAAHAAACDTTFNFTGAMQSCTTVTAGTYTFAIGGAEGGNAANGSSPGLGGVASGSIYLASGTTIEILVGSKPEAAGTFAGFTGTMRAGDGGGGTFLAINGDALAVAGGGAGGTHIFGSSPVDGGDGGFNVATAGGYGGTGGVNKGAGGGGWRGNGLDGKYGSGGFSFADGGSGGTGDSADGGFGGGAGGGKFGGGGGGYNGGDGGTFTVGSEGGTSFLLGDVTNQYFDAGSNSGNGYAIFTAPESAPAPVPLPASLAFLGAGVGAPSVMRRRKAKG